MSSNDSQNLSVRRLAMPVGLLLVALGTAWFFFSDPATAPSPPGHQKMVARLARIAARTPAENPWIGDGHLHEVRADLEALPTDADVPTRIRHHIAVAVAEEYFGNHEAAITHWETARGMLPREQGIVDPGQVNELTYRLAVAYLRLGETRNCCLRNSPDSCIAPIRGEGIHTDTQGSEQAIRYFTEILERTSGNHMDARWLLNIAHMTLGGYPDQVPEAYRIPPAAFGTNTTFPRFKNVAAALGLHTFDQFGGTIVDDFDNDGYLDILTSTWDPTGPMHFFRNQHDGTFADRTQAAGLEGLVGGINMVQADYDNDGDLDVYVIRGAWLNKIGRHPNSLLKNRGDGTFTDVTFAAGLGQEHHPSLSAAWADFDNDGDIDLYVANEHSDSNAFRSPCQLFQNNGNGTFVDVAWRAGVKNLRHAKGVTWGDFNGDRFADLYVSNMGDSNRLYRNNKDGTFTDVAVERHVTEPKNSFPVWFWDYNNDGNLDLYAPSYYGDSKAVGFVAASYLGETTDKELSMLYQGDGQGGFRDVAAASGLHQLVLPMGCNFGDADNDGYLDFYLGTGYPDYEALMPNVLYHNQRGQRFEDVTSAAGVGHLQKGHGIAFADLDHDGDQDIFAQMGGALRGDKYYNALFRNPGSGNHWLTIQLVGTQTNRAAIGARIRLEVEEQGESRSIFKHVNSGGSFGSNPLRQTIGVGSATRIKRLEIYWPTSDTTQVFEDVEVDKFIRIKEFDQTIQPLTLESFPLAPSSR